MALVTRYVDPDATGGGTGVDWTNAYTSLNAWEAAEQTNLVSDGDSHIVYCRSSSGGDDTVGCLIDGWTTGSGNTITIEGADFPSDGVLDATKYLLNTTNATCINNDEDYVTVRKIQGKLTTSSAYRYVLDFRSSNSSGRWLIEKCICKVISTVSVDGFVYGMMLDNSGDNIDIDVINCTVEGAVYGAESHHMGIRMWRVTDGAIFNCTVYNCYIGINCDDMGGTLKNCAIGNCTVDFGGNAASWADYCCSDDGLGTNPQGPLSGSWANEFTNVAGDDFSLVSGGNCIGNGTDDPSSGLYSDDIVGVTRNSSWDIGAFEYTLVELSAIAVGQSTTNATLQTFGWREIVTI